MSLQDKEYIVRVYDAEDGTLWAEVIDLPGCFASGDTLDELREALQETISLYVTDDPEAGQISKMQHHESVEGARRHVMSVNEMRVKVPA
jgi:predicted RNase H-like HicB family nuclease